MAATKPPGKGVTSIASSPSDGMICAMFIVREVFSVVAGEAVLMFFFPPKISEMCLGRWCALQLRLRQYSERPSGPLSSVHKNIGT